MAQVPIDHQLRAPAHRIQMKFSCPKAPTQIKNRLIPKVLLSSLRIIRLSCKQELLVLDQIGQGTLEPHCFDS
ncbi:hypothetical protein SAMN06296036_10563 [Pseudobacteriovorax antillogorgiicola]|uniref:Uncharacterized protein n=2 Tax=Pseudobacteriovorax antillogorgiicola TaxID=1513793 RepID=A0A1Y6BH49_9BACT|nr:hypothetical protein EDD56_105261 [Pseudobacteriovorax antillogorgiicola]SMF11208.1 hypothetical protein SAMN06296036_10563 [Pseudobacteriovorax antillogorgiicola]